jgi:hypothetical protein
MRLSILSFSIAVAALLSQIQKTEAQSAYSYPWCAVYIGKEGAGGMSCYFASYEQCRTTMSGIGGNCIQSPYYAAAVPKAAMASARRVQRSAKHRD